MVSRSAQLWSVLKGSWTKPQSTTTGTHNLPLQSCLVYKQLSTHNQINFIPLSHLVAIWLTAAHLLLRDLLSRGSMEGHESKHYLMLYSWSKKLAKRTITTNRSWSWLSPEWKSVSKQRWVLILHWLRNATNDFPPCWFSKNSCTKRHYIHLRSIYTSHG